MPEGTITKLFREKGYGFVRGPRGYWFFNQSALEGTTIDALKIGQPVVYKEGCGPTGPRADSVKAL